MQIVENKHTLLKRFIAALMVLVILGVVAGVLFVQARDQDEKKFKALVRQVGGRIEAGHQDRIIAGFEDYIKTSPFNRNKPTAMVYLANAYEAKGNYAESLKWYKEIETRGKADAVVYQGIAYSARQLGDRETAKTYYRRALDYLKERGAPPMELVGIEDALKSLEAGE